MGAVSGARENRFEAQLVSPSSFGFPIPPSTAQLPAEAPVAPAAPSPLEKLKAGDQQDLPRRIGLTGDWLGMRSALVDDGLIFYADSTLFYQGVTTGGLRERFRFYGHNDYVALGIGKRLGLWDGFFFKIRGETRFGENAANFGAGTILSPSVNASLPVPDQQIFPAARAPGRSATDSTRTSGRPRRTRNGAGGCSEGPASPTATRTRSTGSGASEWAARA